MLLQKFYDEVLPWQINNFTMCVAKALKTTPRTLWPLLATPPRYPSTYLTSLNISHIAPHKYAREQLLALPLKELSDAIVEDLSLIMLLPYPLFSFIFGKCNGGNWRYAFDGLYPLHLYMWMQLFTPSQVVI